MMFRSFGVSKRLMTQNKFSNVNNTFRNVDILICRNSSSMSRDEMLEKNEFLNAPKEFKILNQLEQLFKLKEIPNTSNWLVEAKVQKMCNTYTTLSPEDKQFFIRTLATKYAVDHELVRQTASKLARDERQDQRQIINGERILRNVLSPRYQWLFFLTGRLKHGVKFLVDFRTDVLDFITELKDPEETIVAQQLNIHLRELLLQWFSVGFLDLERVTWQSSCDMLQKISEYEMIHPMRNWTDLKRRVGAYRRCYVFTHRAMPKEPLVVLHTALCDSIPSTVKEVVQTEAQIYESEKYANSSPQEDKSKVKAAIFYSVASTQKGLQGIELGNYLIKTAAGKVLEEFPLVDKLSTLSPIPNYRTWLLEKTKNGMSEIFTKEEQKLLENILNTPDLHAVLKKTLSNALWINNKDIVQALRIPLLRSCARYLYTEKRRNYALNSVANFHLRNGAVMWRINWLADPSPRGASNSCGIMVNYRYYLDETETNSKNYIERNIIKASDDVVQLAAQCAELLQKSRL